MSPCDHAAPKSRVSRVGRQTSVNSRSLSWPKGFTKPRFSKIAVAAMSGGPFGLGSGHDGARRSRAADLPGFHQPPIPHRIEDNRILMRELVVPNPEDPDGSSALYPLAPSSTSAPATTRLNRDKTRLCQLLLAQQRLLIRFNFSGLPVEVPAVRVSEQLVEVWDVLGRACGRSRQQHLCDHIGGAHYTVPTSGSAIGPATAPSNG